MKHILFTLLLACSNLLLAPYTSQCQSQNSSLSNQSSKADSAKRVGAELDARGYDAMLRQRFKDLFAPNTPAPSARKASDLLIRTADAPVARQQLQELRTMDPKTQTVPLERLEKARAEVQQRINKQTFASARSSNVTWQERGPNNIGGRTRMVMFDPNDPAKKKVWAGGIAGGLWYNNDITDPNQPWHKINDLWESMFITSMAYDPGQPNTMYVGTGESGYSYSGAGIWKTTDGGQTWNRLSSTIPHADGSTITLSESFYSISRLVVNQAGVIYASTLYGLIQSMDKGTSWSFALSPTLGIGAPPNNVSGVDDVELGTDGSLFVSFYGNKIYKLPAGSTNWQLKLAASPGYRTEIALAPSTSGNNQIIYTVSDQGTSIMRSTNGGDSWTSLSLPTTVASPLNEQSGYNLDIKVHPLNPNQLYLGTTRLYRSLDGGNSWAYQGWYGGDGIHPDQHAIVLRPNSPNEMLIGNDGGVYYSNNFGNSSITTPSFSSRNNGYNVTQFYSVAVKNITGDQYLLGGTQDNGTLNVPGNTATPASGNLLIQGDGYGTFIDDDEPNVQVATNNSAAYLFGENGQYLNYLGSSPYFNGAMDYDSRSNTLYAVYNVSQNSLQLKKVSGIGTTNKIGYITIQAYIYPNVIRVGRRANTLFLANFNGRIYKVTNIDQTTATVTLIDLPLTANSYVSCIELGATDDEILVTSSSYGVKSIWLTRDGGRTWTSKDEDGYGLPDIPIYYAISNPKDRRQVMLATELGVWFTNNIYADNPGWSVANIGLSNTRCYMLRHRTADGLVAVATYGRGLFTTDFFTQPIPSQIVISPVKEPICANGSFNLLFSAEGIYQPGNTFTAYLTDGAGTLSSAQSIGTVQPNVQNSISLPTTQANGTYRLLIRSSSPAISSAVSESFTLGRAPTLTSGTPALNGQTNNQLNLQLGSTQDAIAYYALTPRQIFLYPNQVKSGQIIDGLPILRNRVFALQANQPVNTSIGGLMPGTGYQVNVVLEDIASGCLSQVAPIDQFTTGSPVSYCTPTYSNYCSSSGDGISDFVLEGTTLYKINSGCWTNNYDNQLIGAHRVRATADYGFTFRCYSNAQHIAIWLDTNRDGMFSPSERLYQSSGPLLSNERTGLITIPSITSGLYRMRIRGQRSYDLVESPCDQYVYGEAEDYMLDVDGLESMADLSLQMRTDSRVTAVNQPISYQLTIRNAGLAIAQNIVVGSRLPINSVITSATNWTFVNGQIRQLIPVLASGAETTLNFAAMPVQPGTYQTTAQVSQVNMPDPDSRPGSGTGDGEDDMATVDIRTSTASSDYFASPNPDQLPLPDTRSNQPTPDPSGADLSLNMSLSIRNVSVGSLLTLLPTIYNAGGRSVNNVTVQFWLPAPLTGPSGSSIFSLTIPSLGVGASITKPVSLTVGTGNAGYLTIRGAITAASEPDPDSDRITFGKGQDHEAFVDLRVTSLSGGRRGVDETKRSPIQVIVSPAQSDAKAKMYQANILVGESDDEAEKSDRHLTLQLQNSRGKVVKKWTMVHQERIQFLFSTKAYESGTYQLVVQHEGHSYRSTPF